MFKAVYNKIVNRLVYQLSVLLKNTEMSISSEQTAQLILKNQYKHITQSNITNYSFEDVGFRKYSQNSEDGILLFIFSLIGTVNKTAVEICASDGIQCNTANLIINHGWSGLLFDGDSKAVETGRKFYKSHPDTFSLPPKFVNAWITRTNVNSLISDNGIQGDIDLLSIDMDGIDYWIWKEIECINPRVVVAEIECIFGIDKSVTVPYSDDFKTQFINNFGVYSGASLKAFLKLADEKGYRLVGFEKYGFNAFFIRNDIGMELFPPYNINNYELIPFVKWAKNEFLELVDKMEWQEV